MSAMLDFFFPLHTLFLKPSVIFVTFWDTFHSKSILCKTDLIQREIIPTWSYRTRFSTLIVCIFNPAVSFPELPGCCAQLWCAPGSVELSQSCVGCCVDGECCLWRMLPPKAKSLCLPCNYFHTTNSFKALSARISPEGSLWYPALLVS